MTASVKPLPALKSRVLSDRQRRQPKNLLGEWGEQRAKDFLILKNFRILETNVRLGTSEVDVVALDRNHREIVFVEVKSRRGGLYAHPSEAVSYKKLKSMRKVASSFLRSRRFRIPHRFDIICVVGQGAGQTKPKIEHFENVTW